ncbi:MAG TPA: hypothetical protein ENJ00_00255 [Phycisphaerales bacterium]|nr:hypothetical protein [Phycisphaerales bacterium]
MQAKPWQIAVVVIGLLVGIGGIVLAIGKDSGPDLADKLILVDVTTGDTYTVSLRNRSVVIPVKSPETGQRTLLPIELDDETESWHISEHYMPALSGIEEISDKVDPETGKLDLPVKIKPEVIKRKKR